MNTSSMTPDEQNESAPSLWRVVRDQDGRDILRYTFDSKDEAEAAARDLHDPKHPFTYSVKPVSANE